MTSWHQKRKTRATTWWQQFNFDQGIWYSQTFPYCIFIVFQDELDDIRLKWNTHKIRTQRNQIRPSGKPYLNYTMPERIGYIEKKIPLPHDVIEGIKPCCKFESLPCDEDVAAVATDIMGENQWDMPTTPYEALDLYSYLRVAIRNILT